MMKRMTWVGLPATLAVAAFSGGAEAAGRPSIAVFIESQGSFDVCGGGVVGGLAPHGDGFLAVKGGPGLDYARIDKLYNGSIVFVCGHRGPWLAVVYSPDGGYGACNVNTPWPASMPYTGPCRSGWVYERWVAPAGETADERDCRTATTRLAARAFCGPGYAPEK